MNGMEWMLGMEWNSSCNSGIFTAGGGAANEIYGANAWSEVKFKANSPPALPASNWIPKFKFKLRNEIDGAAGNLAGKWNSMNGMEWSELKCTPAASGLYVFAAFNSTSFHFIYFIAAQPRKWNTEWMLKANECQPLNPLHYFTSLRFNFIP